MTAPPPPLVYAPPAEPRLVVLHADESVLVLDKPAGLLAVPGRGVALADCLEARARAAWPDSLTVHRLDLATSGVCVLARGAQAHRNLSMQFARRHTAKTYLALVRGHVWAQQGRIDLPIRADWPNRPRQMIDPAEGRPALTCWVRLGMEGSATRLRLLPLTGRSHQLRLHLLCMGHAILGDPIYGSGLVEAPRLMLHAESLAFRHPADGRPVQFSSPCPF